MGAPFREKWRLAIERSGSLLCVGLDPDPRRRPRDPALPRGRDWLRPFVRGIVRSTLPWAAAYKAQWAAFASFGPGGLSLLWELPEWIGDGRLRILDLKANDIPGTVRWLKRAWIDDAGWDAVTVSPWMGWESVAPWAEDPAAGCFVVAHGSSPGARDLQERRVGRSWLWQEVVRASRRIGAPHGNVGCVVGATYPSAIGVARRLLGPDRPLLVPGVGAQGGDAAAVVREGLNAAGSGLFVNASRSVLFAASGRRWAAAAGAAAQRLRGELDRARAARRAQRLGPAARRS